MGPKVSFFYIFSRFYLLIVSEMVDFDHDVSDLLVYN